jgi:hypothetical protein
LGDGNDFKGFLKAIESVKLPAQTDSQALLYWFLFNVFRLDEIECRDSVCDRKQDKGVDGIWVDEDSQEIFLFQSVYTNKDEKGLGDTDLKEFAGTEAWFEQPSNVKSLLASNANEELKALVVRLDLEKKLEEGYPVKLIFATTRVMDGNGREYLDVLNQARTKLEVWDRPRLLGHYNNLLRKTRVNGTHKFSTKLDGFECEAQHGVRVLVAPVRALDIATMEGIEDRSLFSLNVRSGLGRTRVNRELEFAIREKEEQGQFILFHNGITVICKKLKVSKHEVAVTDYSVVNGCQSAIAFHDNRRQLTDTLQVVARFIEVGENDALAEDITHRSNNQNGINQRDLMSNDRVQIALQKEFETLFAGKLNYAIKAGEEKDGVEIIRNDRAGQWLMAVYLNEPFNAHQKYKLFGPDYERIFGRNVTAQRVYLCYLVNQAIESAKGAIHDELIRAYQLTNLILMGMIADRLRRDAKGNELLENPSGVLPKRKDKLHAALCKFAALLMPDFEFYVDERKREGKGFYDYKSAFKSREEYAVLSRALLRDYDKAVTKSPDESFTSILASI